MGHRVWSCGGRGHAHKGARTGNAIPSLCVCLVGGRAKSVEETRISNTARLHYLHAAHKTQFVPQHWFNPFSSGPRTHTTHSERHKKAVVRNFLKFSAGFFMAFPVVELCPWHYHEYFPLAPPPPFCAFDTFPFADLKRTFHFAPQLLYAFPFFRFSVFRSLRSESAFGKGQVEIMFLC